MDDSNIDGADGDETELDKSLEADLNALRNEQPLTPPAEVKPVPPVEPKAETKVGPTVEPEKKEEPPVPAPAAAETAPVATPKAEPETFRIPVKGPTESEETYKMRVQLFKLIDDRTKAKTPEEKQALTAKIGETRQEMRTIGAKEDIKNPNGGTPVLQKTEDEVKQEKKIADDKAYLKSIGGITKEDLEAERFAEAQGSTLRSFVDRHPEFKDPDTREVFLDFVESNYNWAAKSGDSLMTVLELAREAMYKPSETISERVLKGANVQEKVNAMQFPGGTIVKPALTPAQTESIAEMMKVPGMTEAKALALISED